MSRRRRGSSASWYRKKAEMQRFWEAWLRQKGEEAAKYPLITGLVRSGMTHAATIAALDAQVGTTHIINGREHVLRKSKPKNDNPREAIPGKSSTR